MLNTGGKKLRKIWLLRDDKIKMHQILLVEPIFRGKLMGTATKLL